MFVTICKYRKLKRDCEFLRKELHRVNRDNMSLMDALKETDYLERKQVEIESKLTDEDYARLGEGVTLSEILDSKKFMDGSESKKSIIDEVH